MLKAPKESFSGAIVPTIPFPAHALCHFHDSQMPAVSMADILATCLNSNVNFGLGRFAFLFIFIFTSIAIVNLSLEVSGVIKPIHLTRPWQHWTR